jgi:hypothetical protein
MDRIPPQHIPETANRFEMLNTLSPDIVNHKSENKSVKEASEYVSLRQNKSAHKENSSLRSRQVHRKDSPNKIPTLVNGSTSTEVSTKHIRHNLKSNTQSSIDHKIMILGDCHARGLSSNVKNNLDENYSVCGLVKPGVKIASHIFSLTADINLLTKNDLIIFWGGSNDVSKNNSQKRLETSCKLRAVNQSYKYLPDVCSSSTRSTGMVMCEQ